MMEAEKPVPVEAGKPAPTFQDLKELIKKGDFDTFQRELNRVPEPQRTDLITRNQNTNAATFLTAAMPKIPINQREQIFTKHLSQQQLEMIQQAQNIEETNRLLRAFFIEQPEQFNNFLVDIIDGIPEDVRKKTLQDNHCPKELHDPNSSAQIKQAALSEFLSRPKAPDSLLMESLLSGQKGFFDYLQEQGAQPGLLIFDNIDRTPFDGQRLPFIGNSDKFTSDPGELQKYKDKHKNQFENIFVILDDLNSKWSTQQKNDNRLLNIAGFFGHTKLVASLLKEEGIDPNLRCCREGTSIRHASANTDFRGDILSLLQDNPKVILDGTGMGVYKYLNSSFSEFEEFITKTKGRILKNEFVDVMQLSLVFTMSGANVPDAAKKIQLLFDNGLINIEMFKNQQEQFLAALSSIDNSAQLAFYKVVSQQLKPEDYSLKIEAYSKLNFKPEEYLSKVEAYTTLNLENNLLESLKAAQKEAKVWDGLVKKVSKDLKLQKFLEASAGISKEVDELNKAVKQYNSRSRSARATDWIVDSFTPTNKKNADSTDKLFAQMKEVQTNAESLGVPSLMVDKLLTDLHKAKEGLEKDQALEQIAKNASLFKGSSFEDLVKTAETRTAVKAKRAPEIAKLTEDMDNIERRLKRKKVPELIDNFRNAKGDKELLEAAKDILAYRKNFEDKDRHFIDVAEKIVHTKDKNTKPVVHHTKSGVPDKAAAIAELEHFMENLKHGKTKSLTADSSKVVISNTNNNIGINFINGDKTESAYIRAETGVIDFLNTVNAGKNTSEQLEALKEVIFEKYPLTSHLINPSAQSKYPDHLVLMQYGSYFQEKDSEFAQRWQDHNKLKEDFTIRLKEFVESGMKNPAEFEQYMQKTSREVAEMYEKDVKLMPENSPTRYGKKSKEEALAKVNAHIQGIDPKSQHLSQTLDKTQTKQDLRQALIKTVSAAQKEAKVWYGLVKKVSKDPKLQKFLEANAEASPNIKALNEAVKKYNSRSRSARATDWIVDSLTLTNKKDMKAAEEFFAQMQKTQTNAASLDIPSLVTDERITGFHKTSGNKEKEQAPEQLHSAATAVVTTEQEKRKIEIAKLMDGMDDIQRKIDKMKPKKQESTQPAKPGKHELSVAKTSSTEIIRQ